MVEKTWPLTIRSGACAPLAHRRPGYPLSGCSPAEPDSVSPGATTVTEAAWTDKTKQKQSGKVLFCVGVLVAVTVGTSCLCKAESTARPLLNPCCRQPPH